MSPLLILIIFLLYTIALFAVTWFTARKADSQSFFIGNKVSPWFVVAYGMIGASLSGVTFMSVPGWVKDTQFSYMVVVLGYLFGYFVIALVLLPLYYRLKLTSIYSELEQEMMQKNLSCKNIREAQKNMFTFSAILVFVNLLFLFLGALLLIFMQNKGITVASSDDIFPTVAIRYLGPV